MSSDDRRSFLLGAATVLGATACAHAGAAAGAMGAASIEVSGRGDGAHDEHATLASALAAGVARHVIVPPGTWAFDRTLAIPDRTHLELAVGATLLCRVSDGQPGIVLGNGATLSSRGGGAETSQVIAHATSRIASLITNANHAGKQEFVYLAGLFVTAQAGAQVDTALVDLVSVFANSSVRDCVIASNATAPVGLRIAGSASAGFGPIVVDNVWVTRSRAHNIVITDAPVAGGSATCWLSNITSENQGSGSHGLLVRGTGGLFGVTVRNFHYEHGLPVTDTTAAVHVDGVPSFTLDGAGILAAAHAHKIGISISSDPRNTNIAIRNIHNVNALAPILEDAASGTRIGPRDIAAYEGRDLTLVHAATFTKDGPITDADFGPAASVPDGTLAVDTRANKLYVRVAGTWKSVPLT